MTCGCKNSRHAWMNGAQCGDYEHQTHMQELAGHQCSFAMLQLPGTQLQCCEPATTLGPYHMIVDYAPQVEMLGVHPYKAVCFVTARLCTTRRLCTTGRLCKTMPARQRYFLIYCLQNNKLWLNRAHILLYQDMASHLGMLMQARHT